MLVGGFFTRVFKITTGSVARITGFLLDTILHSCCLAGPLQEGFLVGRYSVSGLNGEVRVPG